MERAWKFAAAGSYMQAWSLDPIASQSLNLETSATRLARVLLVSYLYLWLMMLMGETSKKDTKSDPQGIGILGVVWIWCCLRGNTTPSASDDTGDAHVVLGEVIGEPQLLVVAVPSDQQIQSHVGQGLVETCR